MRYLLLYFLTVSIILQAGCNSNTKQYNVDTVILKRTSKVKIDESEIVLTTMPWASQRYGRDSVLSIVDNNLIVVYNTNTGEVVDHVSIDTLMKNAEFDLLDYVQKNCAGIYKNRRYIASQEDVETISDLPHYKLLTLPALPAPASVNVLVGILTPYFETTIINGKAVEAEYLERSTALLCIDLPAKKISAITHIKTSLLHEDKMHDQVFYPFFETGSLLKNNLLITTVSANPESHIQCGEKVVFALNGKEPAVKMINTPYPQEYFTRYAKSIIQQSIYSSKDGSIYYNDLFHIFDITNPDQPKTVVSLKAKIDQDLLERINTFQRITDNLWLIQTLSQDSMGNCRFKFYDIAQGKLSASKLTYPLIAALEYVVYTDDGFTKFTKDAENTYFEKYKIVDSASD